MVDLKEKTDDAPVRELLDLSSGDNKSLDYRNEARSRLYGYEKGGQVLGLIGLILTDKSRGVLRDLAVDSRFRGNGIGRAMIDFVRSHHKLNYLEAEAGEKEGEFLTKCGFKPREEESTTWVWSAY